MPVNNKIKSFTNITLVIFLLTWFITFVTVLILNSFYKKNKNKMKIKKLWNWYKIITFICFVCIFLSWIIGNI